jgi:hypothetical protein
LEDKVIAGMWELIERVDSPFPAAPGELDAAATYRSSKLYEGQSVKSPVPPDLMAKFFFCDAIEAAYLALVMLTTHSLILTIAVQAAGLSLQYFIYRIDYLANERD